VIPKDKAEAIKAYVEAGYILTPLNGKIPTKKEWQKTKYEVFDPSHFPGNYGVVLQKGDLVIDLDPRNYEKGAPPWTKLLKELGLDPEIHRRTFFVQTGGGGAHIYFKIPEDAEIVPGLPVFKGMEFKTAGNQVVGAWCIHTSGKPYEPKANSPKQVIQLPDAILQRILAKNVPKALVEAPKEAVIDESQQTIDRFTDFCKNKAQIAIEGQNGDKTTLLVAMTGKDMGLTQQKTAEIMLDHYNPRCTPPWNPGDLIVKVDNAFRYGNQPQGIDSPSASFDAIVDPAGAPSFQRKKNGEIIPGIQNAILLLTHPKSPMFNALAFNEFTQQVSIVKPLPWAGRKGNPPPCGWDWTDNDTVLFRGWCAGHRTYPVDFNLSTIYDAVVNAAHLQLSHPVRGYLNAIAWDGRPRLDTWLTKYCGVKDSAYARAVGAKTLMAACARVFQPGVKFDTMLILEGEQGIGKSRLIKTLGGDWYADIVIDPHNKDTLSVMRGKWIIEVSEMVHNRKQEADAVKSFLSKGEDVGRASYARIATTVPRQSIFIGTINPEGEYLKDSTGNRRSWPVYTRQINVEGVANVRDQLFAEALARWRAGESLYLDKAEVEEEAQLEQIKRMIVDDWQERIENWLEKNENDKKVFATTGVDIFVRAIKGELRHYQAKEQRRIGMVMRALKWRSDVFYDSVVGKTRRGYIRPGYELDNGIEPEQEIN